VVELHQLVVLDERRFLDTFSRREHDSEPVVNELHFVASLLIPLLLGLVLHGLCMRFRWLSPLAKPIDHGLTVRGRRLLGANKTYRGIVAVGLGTAIGFGLRPYAWGNIGSALEPQWLSRPGLAAFGFGF
jgi:hypothetical protein